MGTGSLSLQTLLHVCQAGKSWTKHFATCVLLVSWKQPPWWRSSAFWESQIGIQIVELCIHISLFSSALSNSFKNCSAKVLSLFPHLFWHLGTGESQQQSRRDSKRDRAYSWLLILDSQLKTMELQSSPPPPHLLCWGPHVHCGLVGWLGSNVLVLLKVTCKSRFLCCFWFPCFLHQLLLPPRISCEVQKNCLVGLDHCLWL